MNLETFLAKRYLSSHRGRGFSVITWIALSGIVVGVMSLITVLSVMSGFEHELRTKILGNNAHILVRPTGFVSDFSNEIPKLMKSIESTEGVSGAMPVIYGEGFLVSPTGSSEGVMIKGVPPDKVASVLDLEEYLELKKLKDFKGDKIILGHSLAETLEVSPGDTVTILLNQGDFSPLGLIPRMRRLEILDLFSSGMTNFDSRHAYLSLDFAKTLLNDEPRVIEIKTTDPRRIDEVKVRLQEKLGPGVTIHDWLSWNKGLLSALQLEKLVMGVILGLITLVAAFNICGSLIMMVRDKTRDIAILKSMGADDRSILQIFFFQGFGIGLVGTIVGLILGVILSFVLREYVQFPLDPEVYMIDRVPVDIRLQDIFFVFLGAMTISSLATLYPARLAASITPMEGLKSD